MSPKTETTEQRIDRLEAAVFAAERRLQKLAQENAVLRAIGAMAATGTTAGDEGKRQLMKQLMRPR